MLFINIFISVARGKTLMRSFMNEELSKFTLHGSVLDIGGGKNPSYLKYFKKDDSMVRTVVDVDKDISQNRVRDLEKDALPWNGESFDSVLMLNFLEHIYNYHHVLREARRVIRSGGELIGFVPFFMNVHPDPHDYFRYTKEALYRIFIEAGFRDVLIKTVGIGPLSVAFNVANSFIPGFITVLVLPFVYALDSLLLILRPEYKDRYPLGYIFKLIK